MKTEPSNPTRPVNRPRGPKKEQERFYLLAGMGGSAARRKHLRNLWWSIAAGVVVSAALAGAMLLYNRYSK